MRCEIACRLPVCSSEARTACLISNLVSHCYHYHSFPFFLTTPHPTPHSSSYSLAGHSFTLVKREPLSPKACAGILLQNHLYPRKKNKSRVPSDCIRAVVWWFVWADNTHSAPATRMLTRLKK